MNRWMIFGWVGLVIVIALVVAVLLGARHSALATYGTPEAQAEWNDWRRRAAEQTESGGPVERKVPKSAEPPALVLMRDHFAACLGAALVAATGVYGTFMLLLRGAVGVAPAPQSAASAR